MSILYFLGFFAAGQGFFQTFLIASGIKTNSKDQLFLAFIIGFLSLSVLEYSLVWSGNSHLFPFLIGFSSVSQFLFLPLIYFFFKASKGEPIKWPFLHFIPFFIILGGFGHFLFLGSGEKLAELSTAYQASLAIGLWQIPVCFIFIFQCLIYFYFIRFQRNGNGSILGKVIFQIFVAYLIVHVFHTFIIFYFPATLALMGFPILLISILSIYALSYQAYKRNQIIIEEKTPKYFHSNLEKQKALNIISELNDLLRRENYFTNSDIRLAHIAKQLNVSNQHLSQAINQELVCSFREYLNGMRIEYAQQLIQSESTNRVSLKEIAFNSGFNNKTSFSNAFKKKSNMTPSQYLETLR